jgi:phosphoglycolate phosphatase-like HAD superfamily hydrolase
VPATHPDHARVVLVFDFDLTLAPGSVDAVVETLGADPDRWWDERVKPLTENRWDEILARGHALIELAREKGQGLTEEVIAEAARRLRPFPGVTEMFDRLKVAARDETPDIELEFYILSSGFADIINRTSIASSFNAVWGSAFHYRDGEAVFVKRTITHPEKARYLTALVKNLGMEGANAPADVDRPVPEEEMRVAFDQLIYVGDGASDIDAFHHVESQGGLAIAVVKDGGRDVPAHLRQLRPEQRVENIARPDFTADSELMHSLVLAVRSAAARVALRRLSRGE